MIKKYTVAIQELPNGKTHTRAIEAGNVDYAIHKAYMNLSANDIIKTKIYVHTLRHRLKDKSTEAFIKALYGKGLRVATSQAGQ